MPTFFASCASRLEYVLVDELRSLGALQVKEGLSQVHFEASWETLYTIIMWSRVASRIFYPIAQFEANDEKRLYDQASIIDWSQHLSNQSGFVVHSQSFRSELSHTQFISQRIKDAIMDYFRDISDELPEVIFNQPDVVIHCRIRRDQVTIAIDLAGDGLHHRGYRIDGGMAPIKENLAAALLIRSGWLKRCDAMKNASSSEREHLQKETPLVLYDPMCGSGTFLIEAAMMALDVAPGIMRDYLGLFGWKAFDASLWNKIHSSALTQQKENTLSPYLQIIGSDSDSKMIAITRSNIMPLNEFSLKTVITTQVIDINDVHLNKISPIEPFGLADSFVNKGVIITNPPYSERLGEFDTVKQLYGRLGEWLKMHFSGWSASILSPNKVFGHALNIRAHKIYQLSNGSIACELLNIDVNPRFYLKGVSDDKDGMSSKTRPLFLRIEKNKKRLKSYLKQHDISCYRVYDADLPEYNAAIDVYDDHLHIQEYHAPKSMNKNLVEKRLKTIQTMTAMVFKQPLSHIHTKQRQPQKGDWQYNKRLDSSTKTNDSRLSIVENGRRFWINLDDYLDTGLFLDHRKIRQIIAKESAQKSLLNLFCYTASISVYAATAGALRTTNVDLSNTYLKWAMDNFHLNKISMDTHDFIREDCLLWLDEAVQAKKQFDVIFLDPPTFSNSKKMMTHFDIQKDHPRLIEQCCRLLSKNGILYFSNNYKQFKKEPDLKIEGKTIQSQEITHQTTSMDFLRRPLHRCWKIRLIDETPSLKSPLIEE
jgi:23S rRNA (guanine2445-N2)-methyltransferase / 23S rRNA (guanine2069-N7)-methyltransferase